MNKMRSKIQTVLGLINSDELGFCHCHEHLFIAHGQSAVINPVLKIDSLEKSVQELKKFREGGGRSLVDAQPIGCGRMAQQLVEASQLSGVNIVASTGFHKLIFYPETHWIYKTDERQLAKLFKDELQKGMYINSDNSYPTDRISSKAGVIKVALDMEGMTERYKRLFRAAAIASINTGAPILCHTEIGTDTLQMIQFLIEQGVPQNAIIICHLDRTMNNPDYHREVAQTGVYLEYDTIGRYKYHSDEVEVQLIKKMVEWGYEDKILLGLDTTRARLKSYGGEIGLEYISNTFIPLLKNYGISEEVIRKFMIYNPARALINKNKF